MKYYSAIKKNAILPFAATWLDVENIILSEASEIERQVLCDNINMKNLKSNANE